MTGRAPGFTTLHETLVRAWLGLPEDRITPVRFEGNRKPGNDRDAAGLEFDY